jgi:hypothetical protein
MQYWQFQKVMIDPSNGQYDIQLSVSVCPMDQQPQNGPGPGTIAIGRNGRKRYVLDRQ